MHLLEYEAKRLLAAAGIAVPPGGLAETAAQAGDIARALGVPVVVKAQVPVGGRGKRGGVLRAETANQAVLAAERLLGSSLAEFIVRRVLVERAIESVRELYLGVTIDYDQAESIVLLGSRGGADVESPLLDEPPLARLSIRQGEQLSDESGRTLVAQAGLEPKLAPVVVPVARVLSRLFFEHDGLVAEINPLSLLASGQLMALDARLVVDPAALFRQPELRALNRNAEDETVEQRVKREHDFDFVVVDPAGEVGLVSTGAGGTMATLDLIERLGARPYNFADVRTGRLGGDPRRLIVLLRLLQSAPKVRSVLVNVFGAITEMDHFAHLLVQALDEVEWNLPIIARVQGRKKDAAQAILRQRGLQCFDDLDAAVAAAVATARAGGG